MIEIMEISKRAEDYNSYEEFYEKYKTAVAESYDVYAQHGHSWCWSLVGNIVPEHEYGEGREIRYGTKQFSRGTKVFLAPAQWGDGYENVVVIGLPRIGNRYIEVITHSKYIENFRMQKVYKPAVVKRMCSSRYLWWGDTEDDREDIMRYLKTLSLREANGQTGT